MDDINSVITQNQDITFEEAVQYFGDKIPVTAKTFAALENEYQTLAFTVSGYTKFEILNKFHDELLQSIENGETLKSFKDRMNTFLEDKGYEGITNFQADNIFRTNVQTAYQVGHYREMTDPDVLKALPYWQYDAVNDSRTRPSHLAMDGRVFPADSPVWDTWYPPNGYRCRCTVHALSKRQVESRGLTVEQNAPLVAELPDGRFTHVHPDPHFASNPAKTPFSPDLTGYPDSLVRAYQNQTQGNG